MIDFNPNKLQDGSHERIAQFGSHLLFKMTIKIRKQPDCIDLHIVIQYCVLNKIKK